MKTLGRKAAVEDVVLTERSDHSGSMPSYGRMGDAHHLGWGPYSEGNSTLSLLRRVLCVKT